MNTGVPSKYERYFLAARPHVVDGYRLLTLQPATDGLSVLRASLHLSRVRPDLPRDLLVICVEGTKGLCLDMRAADGVDAPLVEVDFAGSGPERPLGKTFGEWLEQHERAARRFEGAWQCVEARKREARGSRVAEWTSIINRVKDYVIGLAAFRYNFVEGCLEIGEFCPLDQPHVRKGEAIKVLLSELLTRARDYGGSLRMIFTREAKDAASVRGSGETVGRGRRRRGQLPRELVALAANLGVCLDEHEVNTGEFSHPHAADLWLACLGLPPTVRERICELETAGVLRRDLIAEVISTGTWSKEEAIWAFLNAPRPEGLLLGTDVAECRPYFVESLNYGRAALLAKRFQQAIMASLTEGRSMEEIEETGARCALRAEGECWVLACNQPFAVPVMWRHKGGRKKQVAPGEEVAVLCRPCFPTQPAIDAAWIRRDVALLTRCDVSTDRRYLILSHEFASPDYNRHLPVLKELAEEAAEDGVEMLFAPTRMDLFLDAEIQRRMRKARHFQKIVERHGALKLRVVAVPGEWWSAPRGSRIRRGLQNASESAQIFAEYIAQGRDIEHYREEFAAASEVVEREALQNHDVLAELDGDASLALLDLMAPEGEEGAQMRLSFVSPAGMGAFAKRLTAFSRRRAGQAIREMVARLGSMARGNGGFVVTPVPWVSTAAPAPNREPTVIAPAPAEVPEDVLPAIQPRAGSGEVEWKAARRRRELVRAHQQLRRALREGMPLGAASLDGGDFAPRPHVFIEMIREYIFSTPGVEPQAVRVAYGDGTEGKPFPLFTLPRRERPSGRFFTYAAGLVSLRHMSADALTERALIRNQEIQRKATADEQESLAFLRTQECVEELLKLLKGDIDEGDVSHSLRGFVLRRPEVKQDEWEGLELHVFHTTGLIPAVIGAYRAIVDLLAKYRGSFIVIPRILGGGRAADSDDGGYRQSEAWF